ncbi:Anaphase-promoting complex subunit 2, partial [Clarias magur]
KFVKSYQQFFARKPEYLEETHKHRKNMQTPCTPEMGIEPRHWRCKATVVCWRSHGKCHRAEEQMAVFQTFRIPHCCGNSN